MHKPLLTGLAVLAAVQIASDAQAAVAVFTDRAAFEAALAARGASGATDGFGTDVAADDTIALANGVTSANGGGNRNDLLGDNSVSDGALVNAVGGASLLSSGFNDLIVPAGTLAFGADFDGVTQDLPTDAAASLLLTVLSGGTTTTFVLADLIGDAGFFGVILEDGTIDAVNLSNNQGARNAFSLDDLTVAAATPVPVPAAFGLFAFGAAALTRLRHMGAGRGGR